MGAREENNQLPYYPSPERVYISYDWASRFGQNPEFPIHKEKYQFDIRLNQTRMKSTLNYLEIRHALELIDFSFHFLKPWVIIRNFTRTRNHRFQDFQFQKNTTNLQWYHLSPFHWGDLEVAHAENGMSWWSCGPQKERICVYVQFASSQGRASSKPHPETGKSLLRMRPFSKGISGSVSGECLWERQAAGDFVSRKHTAWFAKQAAWSSLLFKYDE